MAGTMIGRVFNDRYKITDRIGIGGMAEVYRAEDSVLGRTVAIKVMLPQYAENPEFAARFKQEAASAAGLSSPYIVNIYDWGCSDGVYYIVMELLRGTDLKSGIKARGTINQRKVAEIGSQVCSALSVAHAKDIIHRDIKPQNIMVQPDGNAKVMDFGIARAGNDTKTQASSVLGTAHYISPEQAQGKELDGSSDIYSLGVVMFEACTGQLPFDGPDAISVAMKQVNELPPLPSEFNPNIDPQLEAIIMKALEKNPLNRFESANDMRLALNDYLAGRPQTFNYNLASAKTAYLGNGVHPGRAVDQTAILPPSADNSPMGNGVRRGGMVPANTSTPHGARSYRQGNAAQQEEKGGISRRMLFGIIAAVAALAIIGVAAFMFLGPKEEKVDVPNVTGMTVAEATVELKKAGLVVGTIDKSYDADAKSGQIISQDPKANVSVAKGSKINLVVSLGAEEVVVPDLDNMTAAEAQAALTKAGLVAHAGTAQYSDKYEVNHVMEQKPKAGETVTKGSTVEYVLSLGAENISVPSVVGYSQSGATEALTNAGFKVDAKSEYSDSVAQGIVISQNPNGGKLEKGDTVTIYVSAGPDPEKQPVSIPNVVGSSVSSAKSALEAAGFGVSISGPSDSSAIVEYQSPTGSATKGTTITITTKSSQGEPKTS